MEHFELIDGLWEAHTAAYLTPVLQCWEQWQVNKEKHGLVYAIDHYFDEGAPP